MNESTQTEAAQLGGYSYYTDGPFTCDGCGKLILQGEPHMRGMEKGAGEKRATHRCWECAGATNVGWWPCSQCGVAHGVLCPPSSVPLPPWPPEGWRDPETGRLMTDRRAEVEAIRANLRTGMPWTEERRVRMNAQRLGAAPRP